MAGTVLAQTTVVSSRTWTVSEVERWPDSFRFEIIDGVLYMTALPRFPHGIIAANLHDILGPWIRRHKLGRVLAAQTGVYLDETHYLDPDLVYLRPDQIPRVGALATTATLAIEVLSPSNTKAPRQDREALFARVGIEEIWYVDYPTRSLEVRRSSAGRYETAAVLHDGDSVTSPLFPGLEFPLTELWDGIKE